MWVIRDKLERSKTELTSQIFFSYCSRLYIRFILSIRFTDQAPLTFFWEIIKTKGGGDWLYEEDRAKQKQRNDEWKEVEVYCVIFFYLKGKYGDNYISKERRNFFRSFAKLYAAYAMDFSRCSYGYLYQLCAKITLLGDSVKST